MAKLWKSCGIDLQDKCHKVQLVLLCSCCIVDCFTPPYIQAVLLSTSEAYEWCDASKHKCSYADNN